jgi:hypothetical protein
MKTQITELELIIHERKQLMALKQTLLQRLRLINPRIRELTNEIDIWRK